MKTLKNIVFLIVLMYTISITGLWAQIDDELDEGLDDQEQMEEVKCMPDTLLSNYEMKYLKDSTTFLASERLKALSLGFEYYKQKQYNQAIPYLWKVVASGKKDKYYKTTLKKLIESYFTLGKEAKGEKAIALMDTALLACYKGLKDYPDYITFHYWAGLIQSLLKRYKCAIPHYEKLTQLEPKERSYWEALASLYFATKDERAIEAQQKVVDLAPDDVDARNKLAVYTRRLGGDIYEVYKKNFEKNPDNPDFAKKFGDAAFEEQDYPGAIKAYKKLLTLKPNDHETYLKLGKAYQLMAKYKTAITYYKKYISFKGSDAAVLTNIAECYRGLKSYSNAVSYAQKALRIKPGFGGAYIVIGRTYMDAVSDCSSKHDKGLTYDDKLVYKRAYDMFKKAQKDEMFASQALNLVKSLKPVIPTKEDYFLHKNRKNIKDPCYSWIK